jgi:hypothetical protein
MIMRNNLFDWAGNVCNFPREITEAALAHVIGDEARRHAAAAIRWRSAARGLTGKRTLTLSAFVLLPTAVFSASLVRRSTAWPRRCGGHGVTG